MSTLLNPQGPESPATYWRRRALTAAVGLLIIALAWWLGSLLFGGGGGRSTVQATPENSPWTSTPSASPSASGTPSASPSASSSGSASASATPSASASPSRTPSPTPTAPVACDPAQLGLELTGDRKPTINKTTKFTLKLTNGEASACTLDLGKSPVDVTITSGPALIWTSAHCAKWVPGGKVDLKAKGSWQSEIAWATTRSEKGCTIPKDELKPGTYVATAKLPGGQQDRVVMLLHW